MLEQAPTPPASPIAPAVPDRDAGRAASAVFALLGRARARQRAIVLTRAGLAVLAAFLLVAPVLLALASTGSSLARPVAALVLLACGAAFAFFGPLRARREVGGLGATAHLLAERLPDPVLRRGLVPGFELAGELEHAGPVDFSRSLARAHVDGVAEAASRADLAAALPDRGVRLAAKALFASSMVLVFCAAFFSAPLGRGLRLLVLGKDAPAPKVSTAAEPITGEIELTYTYPAYTRLPTRVVPNTNGDISAPKGTQVSLRTRADREVAQAMLVVGNAALPMEVKQSRELSGSMVVGGSGNYRFRFLGKRGSTLAEGPPIPIAVEEDTAPKVSLLAPMADLEVDPKSQVKVRWEAEDDYGLAEVALVYQLPGVGKPQRAVLKRGGTPPRRASEDYVWDLNAPGLMPGDTVSYFVEAKDNDEVSGAKTGTSRTQKLKIFSEAEHNRKMLQRIEQAWEKLVVLLADRLEAPDRKREGLTPDKIRSQAAVDSRAQELAREFQDAAFALRKDKAPAQLAGAVELVAAGLMQKTRATADARESLAVWLGRGANLDSEPVRRLQRAIAAEIAEEEKDVLYLEALVDQQRIEDLKALTRELTARRRELGDLLEKYRQAPDEETRDRLVREVARLKERMGDLMRRMAELSRSVSDEHLNAEAMEELSQTGEMLSSLDKLQELLHQGKVEDAMKEMEKLGEALDQMEKSLQQASQEFQSAEFDPAAKGLQEFARDLDQLEGDQQQLLEATQKVRANYKKALDDRLQAKGRDFVERLRAKVADARQKLRDVQNRHAFFREDELKRAREAVEELDMALATKDFDQAQESAAKALAHAQSVAEEYERQANDLGRFPNAARQPLTAEAAHNAASTKASLPPLREVSRELESLFPSPAMAMSEQDRQQLRQQAQRQEQLQKKADQLSQKMDELNQEAPLFPEEAKQMLKQAGSRMGRAQGQLSSRNPTGAMAEERAALDQLGSLKKGLQKDSGGGGGGGGMPWPWLGPGAPRSGQDGSGRRRQDDEVKIPGADQYQVPAEYRKDILDAMKQSAPPKYQDQVKRYYEEIVK